VTAPLPRLANRLLPGLGALSLTLALAITVRRDRAAERRYEPMAGALAMAGGAARNGKPAIALVFRTGDCAARLDVVDELNQLAASGAASVTGFLLETRPSARLTADVQQANGIRFPVSAVSEESALSFAALIHASTPIVMVLDSSGALRHVLAGDISDSLSRLGTQLR